MELACAQWRRRVYGRPMKGIFAVLGAENLCHLVRCPRDVEWLGSAGPVLARPEVG